MNWNTLLTNPVIDCSRRDTQFLRKVFLGDKLNIAPTTVLLGQFVLQRLYRSYPLLFGYFLVDLAQDVVALLLTPNSRPYVYTYLGGQAVKLVLAVLVVLELYRLALAGHPALRLTIPLRSLLLTSFRTHGGTGIASVSLGLD